MLRIVFLGPPGSGKGSQAGFVTEKYDVVHISTGQLLRDAVDAGTDLGLQAAERMREGSLIPDELILGLIGNLLSEIGDSNGFLFDGFPRTIVQGEQLNVELSRRATPLTFVLHLSLDPEAVVKRLSGRRTCPDCGAIYNIWFGPPKTEGKCDQCGKEVILVQREDDNEESIRHRLTVYDDQTKPLLDYYENLGLLRTIDASGDVSKIAEEIDAVIRSDLNR